MVTYLWTIQAALWTVLALTNMQPAALIGTIVCLAAAYAFHEGYF